MSIHEADQIVFNPALAGHLGVEKEYFLRDIEVITDSTSGWGSMSSTVRDCYMPEAELFLRDVSRSWTCELSACQVESRTEPHASLVDLAREMMRLHTEGRSRAREIGLVLTDNEVAPADMPICVYNTPRYHQIAERLGEDRLRAACRVTGLHIHVGCRNLTHAIAVHNALCRCLFWMLQVSDHSRGERLELYNEVTQGKSLPVLYRSEEHFIAVAREQGFFKNVSDCWHFIRITRHGTVEVRLGNMGLLRTLRLARFIRSVARAH